MNSPAPTFLDVESAVDGLWREFLADWFDGQAHNAPPPSGTETVFPRAELGFGVAALAQPLSGVGVIVVTDLGAHRPYPEENGGDLAWDEASWTFYVKAKSTPGGDGNSRYQCRRAAQLLRGLLVSPSALQPLGQKGLVLREVTQAEVVSATEMATRKIRVSGQVFYSVSG